MNPENFEKKPEQSKGQAKFVIEKVDQKIVDSIIEKLNNDEKMSQVEKHFYKFNKDAFDSYVFENSNESKEPIETVVEEIDDVKNDISEVLNEKQDLEQTEVEDLTRAQERLELLKLQLITEESSAKRWFQKMNKEEKGSYVHGEIKKHWEQAKEEVQKVEKEINNLENGEPGQTSQEKTISRVLENSEGEKNNKDELNEVFEGVPDEISQPIELSLELEKDQSEKELPKKQKNIYDGNYPGGVAPNEETGYSPKKIDKKNKLSKTTEDRFAGIPDKISEPIELSTNSSNANLEEKENELPKDVNDAIDNLSKKENESENTNSNRGLSREDVINAGDEAIKETETKENEKVSNEKTLEQELEKATKKGVFGKALASLVERNNKVKEKYDWYGKSSKAGSKVMETWSKVMGGKNQYTRLAKRVAFAGLVGAGAGALAGSGALLVVGGLAVKRVLMSAGAGALAGTIHERVTRKKLARKQEQASQLHKSEIEKQLAKGDVELDQLDDNGESIHSYHINDRALLNKLRKGKAEGVLNERELQLLSDIEEHRSELAKQHLVAREKYQKNYNKLRESILRKNQINRALWAGAAGLVTSMSLRFGPEVWDKITSLDLDSIPKTEIPEKIVPDSDVDIKPEIETPKVNPETPEVLTPEVEKFDIPENAYTQKGDGITQILKRQFEANQELAEKFGMQDATPADYAKLAERYGYLNDDFEVRLKLQEGMAYVPVENADGDLVIREFKNGELFERKCDFSDFEGENIDSNEYLEKRGYDNRTAKLVNNDHIEIGQKIPEYAKEPVHVSNTPVDLDGKTPDYAMEPVHISTVDDSFDSDYEDVEIETTEEVVEEKRELTREEIREQERLRRREARRLARLERERRGGGVLRRLMNAHIQNQYFYRNQFNLFGFRLNTPRINPASASGYYDNVWQRGYSSGNTSIVNHTFNHNNN